LTARVVSNLSDFDLLARRDHQSIARLRQELSEPEPVLLGELDGDIADIDGLLAVTRELFGRELAFT
jgi:hypothetical protein